MIPEQESPSLGKQSEPERQRGGVESVGMEPGGSLGLRQGEGCFCRISGG